MSNNPLFFQKTKYKKYSVDFTEHIAAYHHFETAGTDVGVLNFRLPKQEVHLHLNFILLNKKVLHISGDWGSFAFRFSGYRSFTGIALSHDDYVADNCEASEYGKSPKKFCQDKAKDFLKSEIINCSETNQGQIEDALEELKWNDIENSTDYWRYMSERTEIFGNDYFENPEAGLELSVDFIFSKAGLLAACEKMGWIVKCYHCDNPCPIGQDTCGFYDCNKKIGVT